MNWSDERYVRLYTRDTADWLLLSWEARALLSMTIRVADRAGIVRAGRHGVRGLAAMVQMPHEVVEKALVELLEDKCLLACSVGYVLPNFIEAQECSQSDKLRQQEHRGRLRDIAKAESDGIIVTIRDDLSQDVTKCHERSRGVTSGHSVPSRAFLTDQQKQKPSSLGFEGEQVTGEAEKQEEGTKIENLPKSPETAQGDAPGIQEQEQQGHWPMTSQQGTRNARAVIARMQKDPDDEADPADRDAAHEFWRIAQQRRHEKRKLPVEPMPLGFVTWFAKASCHALDGVIGLHRSWTRFIREDRPWRDGGWKFAQWKHDNVWPYKTAPWEDDEGPNPKVARL